MDLIRQMEIMGFQTYGDSVVLDQPAKTNEMHMYSRTGQQV